MYLTTDRDTRRTYRQRLDGSATAPLLSGRLEASRICRWLADGACWDLFVELCRRNGLHLTSFRSLPRELLVEILKWITNGKVLAMMACTCRLLRRLVSERDVELPELSYNEQHLVESSEGAVSWKGRYVDALLWHEHRWRWDVMFWCYRCPGPVAPSPIRRPTISIWFGEDQRRNVPWRDFDRKRHVFVAIDSLERTARGKTVEGGHRKVSRYNYSTKQHGSGAIHSPSSRCRWKHR